MSQARLRRTLTLRMLGPEHAVGAGQFAGSGECEGPVIKATANVQEEHEEEKTLFLNISNFLNSAHWKWLNNQSPLKREEYVGN